MENEELLSRLEAEIERRLAERFAALRDEFDRLRLEADRRWAGFLERFDQDFAGIVPGEMLEKGGTQVPAGSLKLDEARTLDAAANQVEVLHRFLELCRRRASRVALLVAKGGSLGVWKAVGFSEHGLDDEAVRKISIATSGPNLFATALDGTPERLSRGHEISARLEASDAVEAVVIPMVVKEKVSGAVYADAVPGEESRFDPDGIAFLTYMAGLVVDRLAARKLRPAPPLRPIPSRPDKAAEEDISDLGIPRPREVPLTPAAPAASAYSPPAYLPPTAPVSWPEPVAPPPPPPEPEPEPPPPPVEFEVPAPEPEPPPPPPPAAPEPRGWDASPAATIRFPEVAQAPVTPAWKPDVTPAAAPGARRLAGPLARAEGDERREEARRFAKLLVSEIKLYNERAVQEGREQGNIYNRLKEDIDRSRQMYDERIPEDVRSSSNFFYEELVRTLADGRAEALGM
jgi:hypothetical protein